MFPIEGADGGTGRRYRDGWERCLVDVFISYPRASRAKVEPIKAKLEALGLDCFFDLENIDGGQNFPDIIDRALRGSKAVLCCWSPSYFERPWCMIECRDGYSRNILAPVALEAFDKFAPPADLRQVNYYNLTDWDGGDAHEDWNRTLLTLGRLVGRELATPLKLSAGAAVSTQTPAPSQAVQRSIDILADLRATWANFPAKQDGQAVEKFLERVRAAAPGSGLEFEVEHQVDLARRAEAERRRDVEAARFLAQQREKEAAEEARRKLDEERQRKMKDAQAAEVKRQADALAAEAKKLADEKVAAAKTEERRRKMATAYIEAQKGYKKSKSFVAERVRDEIKAKLAIIQPDWVATATERLPTPYDVEAPIRDNLWITQVLGISAEFFGANSGNDIVAKMEIQKRMTAFASLQSRLEETFGVELGGGLHGILLEHAKAPNLPMWGTVGELIKFIEQKLKG